MIVSQQSRAASHLPAASQLFHEVARALPLQKGRVVFNFEEDIEEMKIAKGLDEEAASRVFFQRALAAVRAISQRCSGVSARALAGPPFEPAFLARFCLFVGTASSISLPSRSA
jgi:hypothetical protein